VGERVSLLNSGLGQTTMVRILLFIFFLIPTDLWAIEPCQDNKCDSLAVRAILDSNGLDSVSVQSIFPTISSERIDSLYLHGLSLTILPEDIGKLAQLELLNLAYNRLTSLPAEIGQLTELIKLELLFNRVAKLPPEIGKLTSLEYLSLYGNKLTTLPPEIGDLENLTTLNLENNQLTFLPPEFGKLTNLTRLEMNSNGLTVLPVEITQLTNLTLLEIAGNPFCVGDSIANWLDRYANYYGWQKGDSCQIAIETISQFPLNTLLLSISPNPFTPITAIRFKGSGHSNIRIYDLNGHLIRNWAPTTRTVVWNGQDFQGKDVASGPYIVRVSVGGRAMTKRIVLIW